MALVRLSGDGALDIASRVVDPWPLTPRRATLCTLRHPVTGQPLDRALVTTFPAPGSYTGEDVVELATHGGSVVPASVLAALAAAGAEPALPGEFTRRAVLNGRMDLIQAEAVGDLVDARSGALQAAALQQLDGGLSRRVAALREALIGVEALLAYDVDFPEEDDGPIPRRRVADAARDVARQLDALLATVPAGTMVRDGAAVVIAGAPNAGKSSLLNALVGERRAIVTELPGTTRDAIEVLLDSRPWPLRLVDTAGLRDTTEVVERLGIEVSEEWVTRADAVLACGESAGSIATTIARLRPLTSAPIVAVRTKGDLDTATPPVARAGEGKEVGLEEAVAVMRVSAETGDGLAELLDAIQSALGAGHALPSADTPMVTRARHLRALGEAREEVGAFIEAWELGELPSPVAAVHLRTAVGALDDLVGGVDVEDILARVFSTFCVGK